MQVFDLPDAVHFGGDHGFMLIGQHLMHLFAIAQAGRGDLDVDPWNQALHTDHGFGQLQDRHGFAHIQYV